MTGKVQETSSPQIYEFTQMPIRDELDFINSLEFTEKEKIISNQIVTEIKNR